MVWFEQCIYKIDTCNSNSCKHQPAVTLFSRQSLYCNVVTIGHFQVHLSLCFKARLNAMSLLWKSVFIHVEIGTNYHNKNFALGLALKERPRETRKWPITAKFLKAKFFLSVKGKAINTSLNSVLGQNEILFFFLDVT